MVCRAERERRVVISGSRIREKAGESGVGNLALARGASLTIRGNRKYIGRMSKHLRKEHPSTRRRMSTRGLGKRRRKKR